MNTRYLTPSGGISLHALEMTLALSDPVIGAKIPDYRTLYGIVEKHGEERHRKKARSLLLKLVARGIEYIKYIHASGLPIECGQDGSIRSYRYGRFVDKFYAQCRKYRTRIGKLISSFSQVTRQPPWFKKRLPVDLFAFKLVHTFLRQVVGGLA